jgi:Lhr-like helicase
MTAEEEATTLYDLLTSKKMSQFVDYRSWKEDQIESITKALQARDETIRILKEALESYIEGELNVPKAQEALKSIEGGNV